MGIESTPPQKDKERLKALIPEFSRVNKRIKEIEKVVKEIEDAHASRAEFNPSLSQDASALEREKMDLLNKKYRLEEEIRDAGGVI